MRLRARRPLPAEAAQLEITVPDLLAAGGWSGVFERGSRLSLEIGVGKDPHIVTRARLDAEGSYVGLEYSRKKLDMVLSKAGRAGAKNLRLLRADATRVLGALFEPESLSAVWILFPDPWPKKRHRKKRLVSIEFISLLAAKMRPGAALEVRTDDLDYKEQIREVLASIPTLENRLAGFPYSLEPRPEEAAGSGGGAGGRAEHVPTIFEEKFRKEGRTIHYFYYRRRDAARETSLPRAAPSPP